MSASRRTDTRNFFRLKPLISLLLISAFSNFAWSSQAFENETDTEQPATNSAPFTPPETANLLDGLYNFDLIAILGSVMPGEVILIGGLEKNTLATALFDLLRYMRNNVDSRTPNEILAQIPRYKRVEMFGTWVNENSPENCYNTRAEVLLRDAVPGTKISFASANPCQVTKGEWHDPYSDTIYKLSSAVQIDHVVPLKNAYRSGAYSWSRERRCHFANFLADENHLLAVSGRENMVKSDRGPDEYLPPNPKYVCAYITNWMRIKAIWNLEYTASEKTGIESALQSNNCAVSHTRLPLKELQKNRSRTMHMNVKCADPASSL